MPMENLLKQSAVWTSNATSILLKLYKTNLSMLETPKKKRRIWLAISENLRDHNIEMTPDQVRWKINALTRKYKECIENESHYKFKYFQEIDNIYSLYNNVDSDVCPISEVLNNARAKNNTVRKTKIMNKKAPESRQSIKICKIRLANRLESDRCQTKINLEKQWIDYLQRQDSIILQREEIIDRCLDIKEQELQLRKRELKLKQSFELKNIELKERHFNEYLQVECEKIDLLKQILI